MKKERFYFPCHCDGFWFWFWFRSGPQTLPHLQVLGDEDLPGFLDHGLRLQLLGGELALPGVEHLLTRNAGQCQVGRVRLVRHRDLDGLRVDGAGCVSGCGPDRGDKQNIRTGRPCLFPVKLPVLLEAVIPPPTSRWCCHTTVTQTLRSSRFCFFFLKSVSFLQLIKPVY